MYMTGKNSAAYVTIIHKQITNIDIGIIKTHLFKLVVLYSGISAEIKKPVLPIKLDSIHKVRPLWLVKFDRKKSVTPLNPNLLSLSMAAIEKKA